MFSQGKVRKREPLRLFGVEQEADLSNATPAEWAEQQKESTQQASP
jgi:hypothetical protein